MINLTYLQSLIAISDAGGITAAAQMLQRPQSTIATHIDCLVDEIGRPLLRRIGRGVELTEDGQCLVRDGRALLGAHDAMISRFRDGTGLQPLRIGLPEISRMSQVLLAIADLKESSNRRVEVVTAPSATLRAMIQRHEIDMAIVLKTNNKTETTLWTDTLVWVGSECLVQSMPLQVVTYPRDCPYHDILEQSLTSSGLPWTFSFVASGARALQDALIAGLGLSIMDKLSAKTAGIPTLENNALPLLPNPEFTLILSRRKIVPAHILERFIAILEPTPKPRLRPGDRSPPRRSG